MCSWISFNFAGRRQTSFILFKLPLLGSGFPYKLNIYLFRENALVISPKSFHSVWFRNFRRPLLHLLVSCHLPNTRSSTSPLVPFATSLAGMTIFRFIFSCFEDRIFNFHSWLFSSNLLWHRSQKANNQIVHGDQKFMTNSCLSSINTRSVWRPRPLSFPNFIPHRAILFYSLLAHWTVATSGSTSPLPFTNLHSLSDPFWN